MRNAWIDGEEDLVDERTYTAWADEGWQSWNPYSPELQFCEAAGKIAATVSGVVIETGAGQGYITRRVAGNASPYFVYESNVALRRSIPLSEEYLVIDEPTPDEGELVICDLLIVDSAIQFRRQELAMWMEYAPEHSLLLMHDAGNGHDERKEPYTHKEYWRMVQKLGIDGVKYQNPRGSFLGWKQEPLDLEYLLTVLPNEYPNN